MLTDLEHEAMDKILEAWIAFKDVIGQGNDIDVINADRGEFIDCIHKLQNAILAQSAARVYPDRYRLMGSRVK